MQKTQIMHELFEAITQFDDLVLTKCLAMGIDSNRTNEVGLPPIVAAAAIGFTKGMQILYRAGADPNALNRFGGTILLPSSEKGHVSVVREGVYWGVNVNHANYLGWTALQEALILGDDSELYQLVVYILNRSGADWSKRDFNGKSAEDWLSKKEESFVQIQSDSLPVIKQMYFEAYFLKLEIEDKLPADKFSWKSLDYFMAFIDAYDRGNHQTALTLCRHARNRLSVEEQSSFIYYEFLARKRFIGWEDANLFIKRFHGEIHENLFFKYQYSNFLREGNQHDEAIQIMRELLEQSPTRTDYLFHLANSLSSLGKKSEALDVMKRASTIQPNNALFQN
ncbi:ankyrin repeat domain-containing protein [Psychrobacillus lasiicapitis]|uniref:Tetratricopeptide repeat protein n=1 Tax=Psychrobacillus lasiicapitis TaxID=1636719 RepID=A0A544TC59_9BACI|nr:tetratricopeptide repeat protein [Psychrobacillus lasiicapitis]TQR14991.1 tetratricopeptide repeat protein [Psychrobacillus lasiicapitis]GGA21597.1 hypothetical protein GCM10011384_08910 [Psychrobacillus lasiicapitis]